MALQTGAAQQLTMGGVSYRFAEHPFAVGMPYGQEGRQATVYQLADEGGEAEALKLLKLCFRVPALAGLADRVAPLAAPPMFAACFAPTDPGAFQPLGWRNAVYVSTPGL